MMRFALVVFFFLGIFLGLRTVPSPVLDDRIAQSRPTQPEQRLPLPPPAPPAPVAQAPAPPAPTAAPQPPSEAEETDIAEAEDLDAPPVRTGEADRAGEERTSVHNPQKLPMTPEEIEAATQKELVRLACFTGKPEREWGRKSRRALRRFATRARPRDGRAPTEALLKTLKAYPANYCGLCRPGQSACKIDLAPAKRSQLGGSQEIGMAGLLSYLPPWMTGEQLAQADAREAANQPLDAEAEEADGWSPGQPREKPKARRRSANRGRSAGARLRGKQARRRASWPALAAWPRN
jgi:hypothetical protein